MGRTWNLSGLRHAAQARSERAGTGGGGRVPKSTAFWPRIEPLPRCRHCGGSVDPDDKERGMPCPERDGEACEVDAA